MSRLIYTFISMYLTSNKLPKKYKAKLGKISMFPPWVCSEPIIY